MLLPFLVLAAAMVSDKTHEARGGWFPDLLEHPSHREFSCPDPELVARRDVGVGVVEHVSCLYGQDHYLRLFVAGEVVAGMRLEATQPRGGRQSATVRTVYVPKEHQRRGYATALWEYAQDHFRHVAHSGDFTAQGRAWARATPTRRRRR